MLGSNDWELSNGTWKLLDDDDNEQVSTGSNGTLVVNNDDQNSGGASIKTILAVVDFSDIAAGQYWLFMNVSLVGGYSDHFRALIDVSQYNEDV